MDSKHRKNKAYAVGRAGHDPATYGLKGRLSESIRPLLYRLGIISRRRHNPTVAHTDDFVGIRAVVGGSAP